MVALNNIVMVIVLSFVYGSYSLQVFVIFFFFFVHQVLWYKIHVTQGP